jgi:hypothetical protein
MYRVSGPAGQVGDPTSSMVLAVGHARGLALDGVAATIADDDMGACSVAWDNGWHVKPASFFEPRWQPAVQRLLDEHGGK